MKVSAIMPTYNQARYIRAAINSVIGQVDELVIVDDGCTDKTKDMDLPGTVVRHDENQGTAAAINTGFGMTTGDLVTWVSSDNVHLPNWRSRLESEFAEDVGVVYSGFLYGGKRPMFRPYDPTRLVHNLNCFFGPSFLIRRSVWAAAGGHRGKISHDYDHWLRVEEECWSQGKRIVGIGDMLCKYRAHAERATVVRKAEFDAHIWQKEALKRRDRT